MHNIQTSSFILNDFFPLDYFNILEVQLMSVVDK